MTCTSGGRSPISSRKIVELIGQLEAPDLPRQRAGERALLAAEQLALDQRARNRRAVDAHHDAAAPRAPLVDLRRDELLAGARLAEQQHRRVGGRDLARLFEHAPDGGALADDDAGAEPFLHLPAEVLIFGLQVVAAAQWTERPPREPGTCWPSLEDGSARSAGRSGE